MAIVSDRALKVTQKQEATIKRIAQNIKPLTKPNVSLKRKVGYADEHMSTSQARLEEMEISDRESNTG